MTPEAAQFLAKSHALLAEAQVMIGVGLHDAAGRNAYLAAYHMAQAVIFERTGSIAKTHRGVQTLFQQVTRDDPRVDPVHRGFLSQAYNLKSVADYEVGPDAQITPQRAKDAVSAAASFMAHFEALLTGARA